VLACIAFRQPNQLSGNRPAFDADKRACCETSDLKFVENSPVPTAGCASPQLKHFARFGLASCGELTATSLSSNPPAIEPLYEARDWGLFAHYADTSEARYDRGLQI
jgi:hypothetical protein